MPINKKFLVEIRDYDSGLVIDEMTTTRIENIIMSELDADGSDGIVVVTEVTVP